MLTVNNLTGNVQFAREMVNTQTNTLYFRKGGRTLSFLPLAHAYGCAFDFLSPLAVGGHVTLLGKIPSPKILLEAMAVVRPTVICCVPMILEKVYRKQVMPMLEKGPMSIAVKIPLLNTAIYSVIRKKLLEAFGNNVDIFIVGGAPMNQETEAFLMKIKFPITIGYGWLHTGDMATMDPDGTLYIRGRSKTMILSGSGQNIYPEEIEDKLNNMYLVLESLILDSGEGRLKALVVPDYEQAEQEGVDKNDLPQIMQNNLTELNSLLAAYSRVSELVIYPTEFEKTPKRSIKRYLYSPSLLSK